MTTLGGKSTTVTSNEPVQKVLAIKKILYEEYDVWSQTNSGHIKLISQIVNDDQISLEFAVGQSGTFTLVCPSDYPNHEDSFFIENSSVHGTWCVALNEYIVDSNCCPSLKAVLDKALRLYLKDEQSSMHSSSDDSGEDEEIPMEEDELYDVDIIIEEKKKRWRKKEAYLRKIKGNKPNVYDIFQGSLKDNPDQIFSSSGASGILTNDLVTIMLTAKESGITADPVDDNIYQWHVYLSSFTPGGQIAEDLNKIKEEFGYNHIQLQLDFTMDLYPFYPPVIKIIRPRLEGSTINCVATMDLLKLSNWNPARDMKSILEEMKHYLDNNSKLNTETKRNDIVQFPQGAYLDIENHLMRLTFVSEIPISASKSTDYSTTPDNDDTVLNPCTNKDDSKNVWFPRGTGYSSGTQSGWDVKAYLAAQKEKDHQIELVLKDILKEISEICGIAFVDSTRNESNNSCSRISATASSLRSKTESSWSKFDEGWKELETTFMTGTGSSSADAGSPSTSSESSFLHTLESQIQKIKSAVVSKDDFENRQLGFGDPKITTQDDLEDQKTANQHENSYSYLKLTKYSHGETFVESDTSKVTFQTYNSYDGKPHLCFELKETDIAKQKISDHKKEQAPDERDKEIVLTGNPVLKAKTFSDIPETSKSCAKIRDDDTDVSHKTNGIVKFDSLHTASQMQLPDVEMPLEGTDANEPSNFAQEVKEDKNTDGNSVDELFNVLFDSTLIPFLESKLKVTSFLEICQHTPVYKRVVDIINTIACQPKLVPLLWRLPGHEHSLYDLLCQLEKEAESIVTKLKKAEKITPKFEKPSGGKKFTCKFWPDPETSLILSPSNWEKDYRDEELFPDNKDRSTNDHKFANEFYQMIQTVKLAVQSQGFLDNNDSPSEEIETTGGRCCGLNSPDASRAYNEALRDLQFISCDIDVEGPRAHLFSNQFKKALPPSSQQVVRIAQEMAALTTSLPLDIGSSIFVRTDDSKFTLLKALITGPEGTPYTGGCFVFDIFLPSQYPHVPPHVKLCTTGGGTVRFNPNLYACGRVCLSLLGTWHGLQGEAWLPTSTLLQVLVSIQSLILVPEPFFNEPGYESMMNTAKGKTESASYNYSLLTYTVRYAMLEQIRHPPLGFEEVIRRHFILKKNRILKELKDYLRKQRNPRELTDGYHLLKKELEKLVRTARPE